eukprot:1517134-Prymnesium_polylepis.1
MSRTIGLRAALTLTLTAAALAQTTTNEDGLLCADDFCVPKPTPMAVSAVAPAAGPYAGGTQ